jgi:hypothetical protein
MTPTESKTHDDRDAWAQPIDRLSTTASGAGLDTVTGKRVAGPIQGFGQMWQKTFSVRLDGVDISPEQLVAHWKDRFSTFWPTNARFYAPLSGIRPGEVALLEVAALPGAPLRMSTGVMVIYADRESFTFMTPEGHALSAWITFSATRDGDSTVARVQALERTADPVIELTYMLGANRFNDRFWEQTLDNLARSVGVAKPDVRTVKVCVDRRRQWRYARNIRFSAALSMAAGTITAPGRWLRRRGTPRAGGEG